ncbi:hypothetical protein ALC53_00437, partial [Atta colombica]
NETDVLEVIEKKIEKKGKKYKKFGHNEPHDVCSCGDHRRRKNLIYGVFGPTKFAPIWVEVMMFRALLLVERVTSTNSEAFSNSS